MKRHNFGGLARIARCVDLAPFPWFDRSVSGPRPVFKGKKMAGHMGDERVTVQNEEVVSADEERGSCW